MKALLFTFALIHSAMANDLIATKEADSNLYSTCTISSHEISRVQSLGDDRYATETTPHHYDLQSLKDHSADLIAGISRRFYTWNSTQVRYHVANSANELVEYYASGFENIRNTSPYLTGSLETINDMCENFARDFRFLGKFQIDLKVGDRVLIDYLEVERSSFGNFIGKYVVPNSFESAISDLHYQNGDFRFTIHVQEGDQEYDALFEGHISETFLITGEAFILPARQSLGTFTGRRIQ